MEIMILGPGCINCKKLHAEAEKAVAMSGQPTAGSRPLKFSAPDVTPGRYQLLVMNFGTRDESVAVQVIVSESTCPVAAGGRQRARLYQQPT
jgi:hypothetical protein